MEQTTEELTRQLQARNSNDRISGLRKLKILMTNYMKKSIIVTISKDKGYVEYECSNMSVG